MIRPCILATDQDVETTKQKEISIECFPLLFEYDFSFLLVFSFLHEKLKFYL